MKETIKRETMAGNICVIDIYNKGSRSVRAGHLEPPRYRPKNEIEKEMHTAGISRRNCILRVNAAFTCSAYFLTCTYDNEHYHNVTVASVKKDLKNLIRRWQYSYPNIVIFAVLGEGEINSRMHIHAIVEGFPEADIDRIISKWKKGSVHCERVRKWNERNGITVATDLKPLAIYLFEHWRHCYGGHHFYLSRNAEKPEIKRCRVIRRRYSLAHPPKKKGYALVEMYKTDYGFMSFYFIRETHSFLNNTT